MLPEVLVPAILLGEVDAELVRLEGSDWNKSWGISLAVQWLGFHASNSGGAGSISCYGTKILQATWRGQKNPEKI